MTAKMEELKKSCDESKKTYETFKKSNSKEIQSMKSAH